MNELKAGDESPYEPEPRAPKCQKIESQPITFTEDDASHVQFPHNDPLVITLQLVNKRVHRVLIDNGSSVNILYKATLEKMGLALRDLKACSTTLYGFSGEGIACMGSIELPVNLGDYLISVTKMMMEFVVVDLPSA